MSSCPRCGAALEKVAAAGMCPACLLDRGLDEGARRPTPSPGPAEASTRKKPPGAEGESDTLDPADATTRAAPCREVRVLIEHRLLLIQEKMKEFRHVQRVLTSYLEVCKQADDGDPCQVLDQLDPGSTATGK